MKFCVLTLLPEMFTALDYGIIGNALSQKKIVLQTINPRDFSQNKHHRVDDAPYGGGPGMVMQAQPLHQATLAGKTACPQAKVICLSPQGKRFDQKAAQQLAQTDELILVAGRYEGIDQRYIDKYVDQEWSIGDYVISGGELAAMIMIDAIARFIPGVVGDTTSVTTDTFHEGLLKYPQYTRPEVFETHSVPKVLLSGDHQKIEQWRRQQSLGKTWEKRPDLLTKVTLSRAEQQLLDAYIAEQKRGKS